MIEECAMSGQRQADGNIREQETIGKTLKRRGILAAAAAAVAGIVAKQTSQ
jgi:DNA transposition AAA+ family ATPase